MIRTFILIFVIMFLMTGCIETGHNNHSEIVWKSVEVRLGVAYPTMDVNKLFQFDTENFNIDHSCAPESPPKFTLFVMLYLLMILIVTLLR